ncbi:hypothetical protein F8M41_014807 [Gigaspora margarita]|uniref:Zn(2)-C6 fungal-type domain-containing protein n=1 Tax=Gigaspora margarita TaxID=4874 RepID=A0A8H3WX24_GIGMA|nr:hypothetical protein F8M41_014807 [Gigaspora margarita]
MQSTENKECKEKLVNYKKQRTTNSCIECRKAKKKCSDGKPCMRCTKKGLTCKTVDKCNSCRRGRYVVEGTLYCKICAKKLGHYQETTQFNSNNDATVSASNTLPYECDYLVYHNVEPIQIVNVPLEEYENNIDLQTLFANVPLEEYYNTMDLHHQFVFNPLNE